MGERRIAGLAGGKRLFRNAPRARNLPPTGWPAASVSGRVMGQMKLKRGGGLRLALMGTLNVDSKFCRLPSGSQADGRGQDLSNKPS